jgi:hypothetical protein
MAKKKSTKTPATDSAQPTPPETAVSSAEESATLRLSKPEDPNKTIVDEEPAHQTLEALPPAPQLSDPINRDKEATGEMRAVKVTPPASLEDDPPVIHETASTTSTVAPDPKADHGTMTPQRTPSASEIVANAKKKAAEIVEDRVNMSGSVRQAKSARYEAIQETKAANKAFEKAADEVGSVVDKLAGNMDVMDFLLDKELNDYTDALSAPPVTKSSTTPAATPQATSTSQEPEWKRKATELYEQRRQQEQEIIARRRAQNEQVSVQKTAQDEQLKAGREALEARMREERAAAEMRMKAEREAVDAQRRAEQERLRAERAAMDARIKEERETKDAERRASKKLGRDD